MNRHHRAFAVTQRVFGDALQFDVDRQREIVARHRRSARQGAHRAPTGIDLDLLEAGDTVQFFFVALLDANFADMLRAFVVRRDPGSVEFLKIVFADPANVADHVRAQLAERILAKQPRLDVHAGEAPAVGGKARDLFVGQAGADRQRIKIF